MLEVYEEESPGEPMKPGRELVKELRKFAEECDERGTTYWHPFGNGVRNSAELLQAWLREADQEMALHAMDPESVSTEWVRHDLLGTTRTEGER